MSENINKFIVTKFVKTCSNNNNNSQKILNSEENFIILFFTCKISLKMHRKLNFAHTTQILIFIDLI